MTAYEYVASGRYDSPALTVTIRNPERTREIGEQVCRIDTGADRTIIPVWVAWRLDHTATDRLEYEGFDGHVSTHSVALLSVRVGDQPDVDVSVAFGEGIEEILLGRDILNRLRLTLDGPNRTLELH